MNALAQKLVSDTYEEFSKDIVTFQDEYGCRTTFQELNEDHLREKLWDSLFRYLSDNAYQSIHYNCLSTLRILSRDKTNLKQLISEERIKIILNNAALSNTDPQQQHSYSNVTIESLKLLCNLLYNSTIVQELIPKTSCLRCLIHRMRKYNDTVPYEVILFDTRILFLITALNVATRRVVKTQLNGDDCLINMLENTYVQCQKRGTSTIEAEAALLACEVLKALFNLYIQSDDTNTEERKNKNLISILHKLLTYKCAKEDDLQSNIANILTVIPYDCYAPIIPTPSEKCQQVFQNVDMTAVSVLLKFLDRRLNCKEDLIGNLSPIVTTFIRLVKSQRLIRKYVRLQILPPLKDVMHRPEEGTTLRAKLCKLLTSPLTELRDLVAEFLFILCKENVNRMVKYTGYGNAAGMFANKGLLGQNRGKPVYSSESEDSETEEYLEHKEQINPVTGCFEPSKPDPLAGMTEEQKEYEALQLVSLVDKLTREGLVQPCRIGDDGKPKPIEHVLELQEELPKQQYTHRDSDSD